jgi:hypothetical protein
MVLSLNGQRGLGVWLPLAVTAALTVGGCVREDAPDNAAGATPVGPPPLLLTGDAPWPPRYGDDALWRRAAAGDDFDHARLAGHAGAEELAAAVGEGGSLARVALKALPYAPDRHAARGALCGLLPRADAAGRALLLEALFRCVVGAPSAPESEDPAADAVCDGALEALGRLEPQAPLDRDRALSLRARLHARR